jgi:hypothetical protein
LSIREVANWDADRITALSLWPIRELLLALLASRRREAQERYQFDVLAWAALAPHQKDAPRPPSVPKILKPR